MSDMVQAEMVLAETPPEIIDLPPVPVGDDATGFYVPIHQKDPRMLAYALERLWVGGQTDQQHLKALSYLQSPLSGGGNEPLLVLPYDAYLAPVVQALPATHEMGGHLLTGGGGMLERIVTFEGDACRDASGKRLTATRQCKIRKPDAAISFHTHPKSNRPSSADLRNAVLKHPDLGRRSTPGKRRLSLVVTPDGVWTYAPTPELLQRWRRLRATDIQAAMGAWSRHGRRNSPTELVHHMRTQGMEMAYFPHAALRGKTLHVAADGSARADPA